MKGEGTKRRHKCLTTFLYARIVKSKIRRQGDRAGLRGEPVTIAVRLWRADSSSDARALPIVTEPVRIRMLRGRSAVTFRKTYESTEDEAAMA